MEKEIWKYIEGFENYQISSYGRVKSLKFNKEKILKPGKNSSGYYTVVLSKNNIKKTLAVHRLVAEGFIKNKNNKLTVNHINGDKSNNQVTNLEWITHKQNIQHAWNTGLCENTRKNAIIAQEASKIPIYSKKLDIKFESIRSAATYIQNNYFKDIKLGCLQTSISSLLLNKVTKSRFNFGWSYV